MLHIYIYGQMWKNSQFELLSLCRWHAFAFAILFPAKTYANVCCPSPLDFFQFSPPLFLSQSPHINKRKMKLQALTINNNFLFSQWMGMNYKRKCETCLSPGYGKWSSPTDLESRELKYWEMNATTAYRRHSKHSECEFEYIPMRSFRFRWRIRGWAKRRAN